jgi:hypothetical protein
LAHPAVRLLLVASLGMLVLLPAGCFRSRMLNPPKTCPAGDPTCNPSNPGKPDAATDGARDANADGRRDGAAGSTSTSVGGRGGSGGTGGRGGSGGTGGSGGRGGTGGRGGSGGSGGSRDGGLDLVRDGPRDGRPDVYVCLAVETCGNGADDDCNGLTDCFDPACRNDPGCIDRKQETCDNGIDDDRNGFTDCKDPACFGDKACVTPGREICNNNLDDDGDKQVDCADTDCAKDPSCAVTPGDEICNNGKDDNGDGLADCTDPKCKTFPACLQSACVPDVDFGAIASSGASVTRTMSTAGATATFATCATPGGGARVGSFSLASAADVRLDFSQATGSAHAVALYRAGVGQTCDQNPVDCLPVGDKATATRTYNALPPGSYWLVVQSYPGTPGSTTVTLSTGSTGTSEICNNGLDDDGDGAIDCADLDCASATNCSLCVADINLGTLVVGGAAKSATVDTTKGQNRYHPPCAGVSAGKDIVVQFSVKETVGLTLTIYQLSGDHLYGVFDVPPAGKACDNDDKPGCTDLKGDYYQVANWHTFDPGDYLLIFKPRVAGEEGTLSITLSAFPTRGIEICDNSIDDDGDLLVDCADPDCYNLAICTALMCVPDGDLGDIDIGTSTKLHVDLTGATRVFSTTCGKGDGRGRAYRLNLLSPMVLEVYCTQTGDQILQLSTQTGPLDACDAHPENCADPSVLPGGCNFGIPDLQPGAYYLLVQAFTSGTEGTTDITLRGASQRVLEICTNGIDDDGDGYVDCNDRKCATDPNCQNLRCRPDKNLGLLPLDGSTLSAAVQTSGAGNDQTKSGCVSSGGGQDAVIGFELPGDTLLTIEWAQVGNHALVLYKADTVPLPCEANTLKDCHATGGACTGSYTVSGLPYGKYYLVVDADKAGSEGGAIVQISGKAMPTL